MRLIKLNRRIINFSHRIASHRTGLDGIWYSEPIMFDKFSIKRSRGNIIYYTSTNKLKCIRNTGIVIAVLIDVLQTEGKSARRGRGA